MPTVSDACLGLRESVAGVFPDADWQRCAVHFYRNVFSHVPSGKVRGVAAMLKAIQALESREAAEAKAADVLAKLRAMKLKAAADLLEGETTKSCPSMRIPRSTGSS
jgi:transposase-like protein